MRRCSYCGQEYDDAATVCVIDHYPVAEVAQAQSDVAESRFSVEFIRLFFKSPKQEEFAVRCAKIIARSVGERILLLRPDTTWSEIFQWYGSSTKDAAMFALRLKAKFGPEFKAVLANHEFMTFRDFVEHVCSDEHGPGRT